MTLRSPNLVAVLAAVVLGSFTLRVAADSASDTATLTKPDGSKVIFGITESNETTFAGVWYLGGVPADVTQFGHPTILLENDGSLSDIFGIVKQSVNGQVQFDIGFASDPFDLSSAESLFGISLTQPGLTFVKELPQGNDMTQYLLQADPANRSTLTFWSDGEAVPTPMAFPGALGLTMLVLARRRRAA